MKYACKYPLLIYSNILKYNIENICTNKKENIIFKNVFIQHIYLLKTFKAKKKRIPKTNEKVKE